MPCNLIAFSRYSIHHMIVLIYSFASDDNLNLIFAEIFIQQ